MSFIDEGREENNLGINGGCHQAWDGIDESVVKPFIGS
jgi:hypothetical protein